MKHSMAVWQERDKSQIRTYMMWKGKCSCGETTQYWSWGATLGVMLEHYWKCH
jgi:hypothetical protein